MDYDIPESRILILTAQVYLQVDQDNKYLLSSEQVRQVFEPRFANEVHVIADQLGMSIIRLIDPTEEGLRLQHFKRDKLAITFFVGAKELAEHAYFGKVIPVSGNYPYNIVIETGSINSWELEEVTK